MMYLNISGYKFISLEKIATLKVDLLKQLLNLDIRGTVLLSHEGININLAGLPEAIQTFRGMLCRDGRFSDIFFKDSYSDFIPFSKMVIKLKKEIISMGAPEVRPPVQPENTLQPKELKRWYDEGRDFTILDARNSYEAKIGSFENAKILPLDNFRQFPILMQVMPEEEKEKPIVMFCTGGVRCEKAMPLLQEQGFKNIYQLHGGILNYFEECGGSHYRGECFVFDDRIAVDPELKATGAKLCPGCQAPVTVAEQEQTNFEETGLCLECINAHEKNRSVIPELSVMQYRELG